MFKRGFQPHRAYGSGGAYKDWKKEYEKFYKQYFEFVVMSSDCVVWDQDLFVWVVDDYQFSVGRKVLRL